MQLYHLIVRNPGVLVQVIDILGNNCCYLPLGYQTRHREMAGIRLCIQHSSAVVCIHGPILPIFESLQRMKSNRHPGDAGDEI